MSINNTLIEGLKDHYSKYCDNFIDIEEFLKDPDPYIKDWQLTIRITQTILDDHGKAELGECIHTLGNVEYGTMRLNNKSRDHVLHALFTFLLGIYIAENFLNKYDVNINPFQWKIACLFHDIGYPLQIANQICKAFGDTSNSIKHNLHVKSNAFPIRINYQGLERLTGNRNSYDLIYKRLDEWCLDIDAIQKYVKDNECDHGIISSLSILYLIDSMYYKNNPERLEKDIEDKERNITYNQKNFEEDVVAACSAIFVHNLDKACFQKCKIDIHKASLAYLLRLSDAIQEWSRPSYKNPGGSSSDDYLLSVDNCILNFAAFFPDGERDKKIKDINEVISAILDSEEVIRFSEIHR